MKMNAMTISSNLRHKLANMDIDIDYQKIHHGLLSVNLLML